LAEELNLDPVDYGTHDGTCEMFSEVYDGPGLYCLDPALPDSDSDGYDVALYQLWRRLAGEVATDEEATTWAAEQAVVSKGKLVAERIAVGRKRPQARRPQRREHAALSGGPELAHRRGLALRGVDLGGAAVTPLLRGL
jgi:hypothetical protein